MKGTYKGKKYPTKPVSKALFGYLETEIDYERCSYDAATKTMNVIQTDIPTKTYKFVLYSSNITAPIYNLPLQRTLMPLSDCSGWLFSVTPFAQPNSSTYPNTLADYSIKNAEVGALIGFGYYGSRWYLRGITALTGSKITYSGVHTKRFKSNDFQFYPFCENFLALGLKTDNAKKWQLGCEGFVGFVNEKTKKNPVPAFMDIENLGTGAQVNFNYIVAEKNTSKYEVSALSRYTCFVPKSLKFVDHADGKIIGNGSYTPGSFLDLFFAFKQYYGSNYQHSVDLGYNPTFHVKDQIIKKISDNTDTIELDVYYERIPTTRHSIYGIYAYNWMSGKLPMNINIGSALSFGSNIDCSGTFFSTFGLSF